jgi:hypothetical protein
MNVLAKYLQIVDFEVMNIGKEIVSSVWDHSEELEHVQIARNLEAELLAAKENLKLFALEDVDPDEPNENYYLTTYNGNIMTIKRLINRFNTGE